ncbi:hypothetical protein PRIPAC_96148 [Pristionchus pacificus]|uniref:Uncharacterized protein n=1 Tax=Pristionchus pacificus TaxID=54126 RepID=A0A2A6B3I2_PRIPA|nr:hypothetical protein PRIPAC_96148 [Pristionchus pacificus]|eukprot:PDM60413.1 hypothetical protein PRIPAC_54238 [Pristionchus pacificus]
MNSSELSPRVFAAIVSFHHIGGAILLSLNLLVCFLIIFVHDARGKVYRKYLLSLQVSSMLMDILSNTYTPILLVNCRIIFSDSWLARYVEISVFGASVIILFLAVSNTLFLTVSNAYFACVYYRRSTVPIIVAWVKFKASYMFLRGSIPLIIGGGVSVVSSILMTVVSLHTGAHSLTILACSPSYRKAIQQFIPRMVNRIHLRFSGARVAQRKSIALFTHSIIQK